MKKITLILASSLFLMTPVMAHEVAQQEKNVEVKVEKHMNPVDGLVTTIETRKETWVDPVTGKTMTRVMKRKMKTRENPHEPMTNIEINGTPLNKQVKKEIFLDPDSKQMVHKLVKVEQKGNETHTIIQIESQNHPKHKVVIHHVRIFDPATFQWSEKQEHKETYFHDGKQVNKVTKIENINGQINKWVNIEIKD